MKLLTFLFLTLTLVGLGQQTVILPDCIFTYSSSSTGASTSFNNTATRCTSWAVVQEVFNGSTISSTFQQAPSDSTGAAPGTFVTFVGTGTNPVTGTNPQILTPATATFTGFVPWVRFNVTSLSGTLRTTAFGWRVPNSISSGSGGGGGGGNVTVVNADVCDDKLITKLRAGITFTAASGSVQVVPLSGTTQITICGGLMLGDTSTNIKLISGTGTACATGTVQLTGTNGLVTAQGFSLDDTLRLPALTAGHAFCINSSAAITAGGFITYVQQ